ncbi:MAG: glycosyltransferase family 9 protein [Desulfovibrionales bacterium]
MNTSCVIRLNALGDVVLTTGVLLHWHRTRNMRFTVITRKEFAPIFAGNPAVEGIIGLESAQVRAWLKTAGWLRTSFAHTLLVDLHGTLRTRILALLWQGKTRHYAKYALERRMYRVVRLPWVRKRLTRTTVLQRYALALDADPPPCDLLLPKIFLETREKDLAARMLRNAGVNSTFVALHPYATHAAKTWPREHWLELIRRLEANGYDWVVLGRSAHPLLSEAENPRDLTNRTELRITCAILHHAKAMVTSDSGPMHLATAVGTPVTALFGPTSREWGFHPCGPRDRVLSLNLPCSPCSLHGKNVCQWDFRCMRELSPEAVLDAVCSLPQGRSDL